ncbi:MAG TPA: hypothetical protein VL593_06690 [Ramlibacter sp.]|jgi:hypothetical protein|nr:hypothetical protein [Ramlibacter sp.]
MFNRVPPGPPRHPPPPAASSPPLGPQAQEGLIDIQKTIRAAVSENDTSAAELALGMALKFEQVFPKSPELRKAIGDFVVECCASLDLEEPRTDALMQLNLVCLFAKCGIVPDRTDVVAAMSALMPKVAECSDYKPIQLTLLIAKSMVSAHPDSGALQEFASELVKVALVCFEIRQEYSLLDGCTQVIGALRGAGGGGIDDKLIDIRELAQKSAKAFQRQCNQLHYDPGAQFNCLRAASDLLRIAKQASANEVVEELSRLVAETFLRIGSQPGSASHFKLIFLEAATRRLNADSSARILQSLLNGLGKACDELDEDERNRVAVLSYHLDLTGSIADRVLDHPYPDWLAERRKALDEHWCGNQPDVAVVIHAHSPLHRPGPADIVSAYAPRPIQPSDWPGLIEALENFPGGVKADHALAATAAVYDSDPDSD